MRNKLKLDLVRQNKELFLIVIVAFILRLIGVSHSLPFVYNVDEPTVVRSTIMLRESLNPGHFDWPHFYYYINGVFYIVFVFIRSILEVFSLQNIFLYLWQDPEVFYLISRVVTSLFASLTIIPVYKSIRLFSSKQNSLLTVLVFSLIPYHIFISSFAVLEPAMLFFIATALYFNLKIYLSNKTKDYILTGIFIGLACSIKYNAIFSIFPLVVGNLLVFYKKSLNVKGLFSRANIKNLSLFVLFLIGAFLLTSPFILLDFKTFVRSDSPVGFLWQAKNLGRVSLEIYPYQVLKNLFYILPTTISIPLWGIFIYKLFQFVYLKRRKATEYISLIFIVIYVLYVSQFERQAEHYFVPLYVFITVFCLDLLEELFRNRKLLIGFICLMLIQVIYFKILIVNTDSRTLASQWVEQKVNNREKNILRYGEYFPVFNNKNIKLDDVDEFFYKDLAGKDYPQFIIWSNYYLWQSDLDTEDWKKLKDRTNQDGEIKYFSGFLNLGPNIVIFNPNW